MTDRRGLRSVPKEELSAAEDFELVRRFKASGDPQAFEALFRRHQQYVASLCLSILRSSAESEDALQEIFIKVYNGLHTFEPKVTFRGWLYRIAINHCRDLLEKRSRRAVDDLTPVEMIAQMPKQESGLVALMMLEAALEKLSPDYRTAFILQAVEGYSIAEVADFLGIGFEAAASRLRRATKQFSEAYELLCRRSNRS